MTSITGTDGDEVFGDATGLMVRFLAKTYGAPNPKRPLKSGEVERGLTAIHANVLGLLADARVLATAGRYPRAGALIVLALEEMAKVPVLFNAGIAVTRGDAFDWVRYWKEFSNHSAKQKLISAYGRRLKDGDGLWNDGPYERYLPDDLGRILDIYKQRSFYTDFFGGEFVVPGSAEEMPNGVVDQLLLLAEERADSFERLHGTTHRSRAFMHWAAEAAEQLSSTPDHVPTLSLGELVDPTDAEDVRRDIHSLVASRSSASVPDYQSVYSHAEASAVLIARDVLQLAIADEGRVLGQRLRESKPLPACGARAFAMLKLTIGFALHLELDPPRPE